MSIEKIDLRLLVSHEECSEERVLALIEAMKEKGCQLRPIVVSNLEKHGRAGYLIHDGHHRAEALRRLGMSKVVANVIDFESEAFVVKSWRDNTTFDKHTLISYAVQDKKFPPKTTKHVVIQNGEEKPFMDNAELEPELSVSMDELR